MWITTREIVTSVKLRLHSLENYKDVLQKDSEHAFGAHIWHNMDCTSCQRARPAIHELQGEYLSSCSARGSATEAYQ